LASLKKVRQELYFYSNNQIREGDDDLRNCK
jgi:hypothetical protein